MKSLQRRFSKIKHRKGKEKPGRTPPQKKLSTSSVASSHDTQSTALPKILPYSSSKHLCRSESLSNIREGGSSVHVCSRKMTTVSVEDGYVRISQETPATQERDSDDGPSPRTTMYQENNEPKFETELEGYSFHETVTSGEKEESQSPDTTESICSRMEGPAGNNSTSKTAERNDSNLFEDSQPQTPKTHPRVSIDTKDDSTEPLKRPSKGLLGSRNEWDKLRLLRKDALGLRSLLQKQRNLIQIKEDEKEMADSAYLRYLRAHPPINPAPTSEWSQPALEKLYADLQQARNEHGPALVECMKREEALDVVEFEMGRIEDHLYVLLFGDIPDEATIPSNLSQIDTNLDSPSNPSPWLGLVAGIQDRFEPLQTKYLSRLGDLDLANERMGILEQEKENLLAEQEASLRIGRELSDDSKAVLRDLPHREAEIRLQVAEIQRDVENLRRECMEAGLEVDEISDTGSGKSLSLFGDDA